MKVGFPTIARESLCQAKGEKPKRTPCGFLRARKGLPGRVNSTAYIRVHKTERGPENKIGTITENIEGPPRSKCLGDNVRLCGD